MFRIIYEAFFLPQAGKETLCFIRIPSPCSYAELVDSLGDSAQFHFEKIEGEVMLLATMDEGKDFPTILAKWNCKTFFAIPHAALLQRSTGKDGEDVFDFVVPEDIDDFETILLVHNWDKAPTVPVKNLCCSVANLENGTLIPMQKFFYESFGEVEDEAVCNSNETNINDVRNALKRDAENSAGDNTAFTMIQQ